MATYNFTVRATDNLGAYADQNFSLTVNNTNIERWVIVGSTGLIHSSDGQTWTTEAGQSGGRVSYGNGKWVVYSGNNNHTSGISATLQIRTSTDAFNWTTSTITLPVTSVSNNQSGSTQTYTFNTIQSLKYQNGMWTALISTTNIGASASAYYCVIGEFYSADLVTWQFRSSFNNFSSAATSVSWVFDHYMDPAGNLVIVHYPNAPGVTTRLAGNTTYSATLASMGSYLNEPWITYTGGLWCVGTGTANSPNTGSNVYTSVDATGWTARSVNTTSGAVGYGQVYANGRLLSRSQVSAGSTSGVSYSLNGGRSWTGLTTINHAGTAVSNYGTVASASGTAYYGGRLITLEGQNATPVFLQTSLDSGATWTAQNLGTSVGVAQSIAVRVN